MREPKRFFSDETYGSFGWQALFCVLFCLFPLLGLALWLFRLRILLRKEGGKGRFRWYYVALIVLAAAWAAVRVYILLTMFL